MTPLSRGGVAALVLTAAAAASAQTPAQPTVAATAPDDRGFSYFLGIGRQQVTYEEMPSLVGARSRAQSSSPLLTTGALYAINADNLLSLDSEATFAPGTVTERWTATGPTIPGNSGPIVLTSPLLQTNRYSLQQNTTRLMWQHRLRDAWFATGGVSFHNHSFKRFGFAAGPDNAVNLPVGTVEETVSEAMLNLGFALESERVRQVGHHYGLRVGVAVPVWRRVQNTGFPNDTFGGTSGWDLSISGRYSIAVRPNMHIGAWGQWVSGERGRDVQGLLELPRSEMRTLSYGIELLWKL